MKYLIALFLAITICLSFNDSLFGFSKYIVKTWDTNGATVGEWTYLYQDQWGGFNYQCQMHYNATCNLWSWQAKYPCIFIGDPDPCPQINNTQYGENLSRAQGLLDGFPVPPNITFNFSIQEIIPQ